MSRFAEDAASILAAAESASVHGEAPSEMTILIGHDGGIHMIADSDWPLDSLARHHGATRAYRVSTLPGSVRVEGREGLKTCVMHSIPPEQAARALLGSNVPAISWR